MPRLSAALALLTLVLLAPAATQASVVTTPGAFPALTFTADPGEENRGSIECTFGATDTCVVTDFADVTENSDICVQNNADTVTCTDDDMSNVPVIDLGDLDDSMVFDSGTAFASWDITAGPGDDTITASDSGSGDTVRAGKGADWVEGGFGGDEIRGGEGRDILIGNSGLNHMWGDAGNDVLMSGPWLGTNSDMEGGDGDDTLIGGWSFDIMKGGAGDDTMDGGRLNDQMDGGADFDIVDYGDREEGVVVAMNSQADDGGTIDEGAGGVRDRVGVSVEAVYGGEGPDQLSTSSGLPMTFDGNGGDDTLVGSAQIDTLRGGSGGDTIDGRFGGDTIDGEGGNDTALYTTRSAPIAVSLDDARNDGEDLDQDGMSGGPEEGDLLRSIENASTGSGDDILIGGAGVNVLLGGPGNDSLEGLLGADTLDGQSAIDTVDYSARSERVAVRLDNARNDGADPNGDKTSGAGEERDLILNVENALGGSGNDFLWGNAVRNFLISGAGADSVRSRDGTGVEDVVNCGQSASDTFDADPADTVSNCETAATLP